MLQYQDYVAKRFRKAQAEVAWKKLFTLSKDDIQRLELVPPGGKDAVVIEKSAAGALEVIGLPEGKKTKSAMVTTVVNTLPNLKAKDFVAGKTAAGLGLTAATAFTVKVTGADGATTTLLIEQPEGDAPPHVVADNGPLKGVLLTVNAFQAKNLQKPLAEFVE